MQSKFSRTTLDLQSKLLQMLQSAMDTMIIGMIPGIQWIWLVSAPADVKCHAHLVVSSVKECIDVILGDNESQFDEDK